MKRIYILTFCTLFFCFMKSAGQAAEAPSTASTSALTMLPEDKESVLSLYNAEIQDVMRLLTEEYDLNVVMDDVTGKVSLRLRGVSLNNALDAILISRGYDYEIRDNIVTVLADTAERVEEIDVARAEEARQKAQKLLTKKTVESEDYALLQARLEKELARLKIARKHRKRV